MAPEILHLGCGASLASSQLRPREQEEMARKWCVGSVSRNVASLYVGMGHVSEHAHWNVLRVSGSGAGVGEEAFPESID